MNNGQDEIDNNIAKRLMKPVYLGRKNYCFVVRNGLLKYFFLILFDNGKQVSFC